MEATVKMSSNEKIVILDWDMKIKKVEKHLEEYYTPNRIYEVRNGKVVVDKDYSSADKEFTLEEFLKSWDGEWIITRVKINDAWYRLERKNSTKN